MTPYLGYQGRKLKSNIIDLSRRDLCTYRSQAGNTILDSFAYFN